MTKFIHSLFTPSGLELFQGYHFQIFSSGRAKVTFQGEGRHQVHYYADRPKRDKEGYHRQKLRSGLLVPDHFDLVDRYVTSAEGIMIFRLHLKGDNNATADNAHLLATRYETCAWLIFDSIVHEWDLPAPALGALLVGRGPRTGTASVFHEFVPTYEHDWQTAAFDGEVYRKGYREQTLTRVNSVSPETIPTRQPSPTPLSQRASVKPQATPSSVSLFPVSETIRQQPDRASDILQDDPYDDPIFFAPDPDPQDLAEYLYNEGDFPQATMTKTLGTSTLYSSADLRKQVLG